MSNDRATTRHLPRIAARRVAEATRVGRGTFPSPAATPQPSPAGGEGRARKRRKTQAAIPPREARRARLDRARQAGRHDLDPGGRRHQAAVLVQARRPRRHARSARLRLPADRARRSDQDRPVRHGRPQDLQLHRALGRGARHRRRRRPRGRRRATRARTARAIAALLPGFIGTISQVPPQYSAIKIDGERAYDLARDGETVDLQARPVEIHRLELVEMPDADHAEFRGRVRQGHLCALARPRYRPGARMFGTCQGVTARRGRLIQRKRHDFAGTADSHVS